MRKFLLTLTMILTAGALFASNPVMTYFTSLFDETKAELAIGKMMSSKFLENTQRENKVEKNEILTQRMLKLAEKSPRKNLSYTVYTIESPIADAIIFPDGTLFVTTGLLSYATMQEQIDFILGRNVMHIAMKNPIKLIKRSGLYPKLLRELKEKTSDKNDDNLLDLIHDYMMELCKIENIKADTEAVKLTSNPENTRKAAISMLTVFKVSLWPIKPINTNNNPERIKHLRDLKL